MPDMYAFFDEYREKSNTVYKNNLYSTYAYGESLAETIDIFLPPEANPPLHVFIHGGFWQVLSKQDSVFNAPFYLNNRSAFGAMSYGLVPDVSLDEIVQQTRWMIWFLYKHAEYLGFDRDQIHLSGHSAGAHLAFMALFTDWKNDFDIPDNVIKSITSYSGVFDLEPLLHTPESKALNLDKSMTDRNSPIQHIVKRTCELNFLYGDNETSEFKRQTLDFAAALKVKGMKTKVEEVKGKNHFDVVMLGK